MSVQFVQGQVAVSDTNPGGPSVTSNIKDLVVKVVRLTSANFSTTNVDVLAAVLPADATILDINLWVKTQLAGGGITAATISVGSSSGGTQFINANASAFSAAGVYNYMSPINNIMQNYQVPAGSDIQIFVRGTATTGNPTSGEMYLVVEYVR
jgi:hypothetical protein